MLQLGGDIEQALDKRTSMGIVGDLNRYTQFQTAEAIKKYKIDTERLNPRLA